MNTRYETHEDNCCCSACNVLGTRTHEVSTEPSTVPAFRRFYLQRHHDKTGISGTGRVANGVVFPDGRVAMRWCVGQYPTTVVHDSIASVEALHVAGHGPGANELVWIDEEDHHD